MYFDQRTHAWACVHRVKNNEKHLKIIKKVLFSSYTRETQVRLTQEHEQNAIFYRLGVTPKCWLTLKAGCSSAISTAFFFMFLYDPYMSLSRVRWKKYFFDNFQAFFIVFDHVNPCEIHNIWLFTILALKVRRSDLE